MKTHSKVVWLGYASLALALVWGVGIVPAIMARRMADAALPSATAARERSDLRGGRFLATLGLGLNILVIVMILWSVVSTWVL